MPTGKVTEGNGDYSFRDDLTPAQRATPLNHTIDPGFVHHRLIETVLGTQGIQVVDDLTSQLPGDLPDWTRKVRMDHIYTYVLLLFCNKNEIPSLGQVIAAERGRLFCSTEQLAPCPEVYTSERAVSRWVSSSSCKWNVEFHYSTTHIAGDTVRSQLSTGARLSIVARFHQKDDHTLVFHPLVIGNPWLQKAEDKPTFDIMWYGRDFFQNFVEDFAEFARVTNIPNPTDPGPMRNVTEHAVKSCIQRLLGDSATPDWGGETSDFFTAHLHLGERRLTGAFLLKGPAHFAPMKLTHLGKHNDQIVRLSHEPADVLFLQHCHDVLPQVRETLRAFAVQPSNPRRYCVMDGRDSLRLLQAYDLYHWAVEISRDT